jgi:hypothetical protein
MQAKERLYLTVDGEVVREGDPRGAFLKYGVGDDIEDVHADAVSELTSSDGVTSQAYHNDEARDALRVRQANPDIETRAATSAVLTGDPHQPVLLHDRLATELADEARERANRDEALEDSDATTQKRLYWTAGEDGQPSGDTLVREGHPDAAFLAYAPGDKIRIQHLDAYESMDDDDDPDRGSDSGEPRGVSNTPGVKAAPAKAAPAKAAPAKATANNG